ncbi:DUF4249 domain-containing protein [Flagellimonas aquimarina]|uniref:DUF4249 domain-containing protein n=1 Tax=Flagellimonas aquimarina TaxID=2201895 RepID=A0A316KX04_9FLAO|nr:DUF4249 domain-containing protein [Allomuricauda koreensis]PWL38747.1 DUF4249 domain-containing protein [Allomuricauda koreensis]
MTIMIDFLFSFKNRFLVISMAFSLMGCIEAFDAEFVDFESALVIEATITNELKQQRIFLSRSYEFDAEGPLAESNATVSVSDGTGTTFSFEDTGNGVYVSSQAFAAEPGRDYELSITTQDGRSYGSETSQMTSETTIDEVIAERITNDDGEDGMAILVNSFDPSGNAKNYRYEYEETYRIIAPEWNPTSLIGDPEGGCAMLKVPNTTDDEICYRTDFSNRIILTSTEDLEEDRVSNFMVRFISRDNYIISHRYSVLVRQLVQSNEAFTFFETLNELSGSESLFSQTQPGFLEGNVFSNDNRDERVLGFFDVSSVSERRIFFNYDDFYPGEDLPPYIESCRRGSPPIASPAGCVLRPLIESGAGVYAGDNGEPMEGEGPFFVVSRVCGDCNVLGSPEVPNFWVE